MLDKQDIGTATSKPMILAGPGAHRLRLIDLSGQIVDQVFFTVR